MSSADPFSGGTPPARPTSSSGAHTFVLWSTFAGVAALLLLAVGWTLFLLVGLFSWGDWDDDGTYGSYESEAEVYYIEDESVLSSVATACSDMVSAGESLRIFAGPEEGAQSLREFAAAIGAIITVLDESDSDDDAVALWRADWATLQDRVEQYAVSVEAGSHGSASLDGMDLLTYRVSDATYGECAIPGRITALDPEAVSYY